MNANVTEAEYTLIQHCLKGERMHQKALYDLYAPKLFALCVRYTQNKMDAEDVLQDGFVKLFKYLDRYKGEGSFEGWIRRIFINTAIEFLRRKNAATTDCQIVENTLPAKEPDALDNLYNKDLLEVTRNLSRGYRTVFNLYEIQGFTHHEIAQKLGITESTSKSQFLRAKALLRTIVCRSTTARF